MAIASHKNRKGSNVVRIDNVQHVLSDQGTATHLHFTCGPVNFGVVLLKPTKPKYHLALPQSCDCKLGLFGVIMESHDDINNIMNRTLLIGGPIHIVHRNSLC